MCQSAQKNTKTPKQELQNIADITTALWNEWISNSDAFQKRHGAKRVLDSFAQLSRALSQAAKSQEEFEHLATLCGHPLAQNHFRLGMLFLHKLDQDQAIENFRKSVDLDPTNYEHYMKYAEVLFNAKMYGTAIQAYTTILTASQFQFQRPTETPRALPRPAYYDHPVIKPLNLKPPMKYPESKLAEVVFRRALAHLQHQDLDEALADYRTVTSLDSNHRTALAWAYLAYLSRLYGKWTQTAELATKALEVDNQLLMALYERSMAYYVLKNEEAMKEDNRKFAILAHEKMWSLSKHPTAPEWGLPYVKPKRGRSYKL